MILESWNSRDNIFHSFSLPVLKYAEFQNVFTKFKEANLRYIPAKK
jgi:hypothetical protein